MDGDLDLDVVGAAYTSDQVGFFANTNGSMGIQVTAEDTPRTFNVANNNLISISDVDAGSGEMKVRLEITSGVVSLSGIAGLILDAGTGTDDAIVEFRGDLTDINAALDGLVFTPTQDHVGNASIRIITDDQGNSGAGSALVDDDIINITVTPVNDDPVITSDGGGDTANVNVAEGEKRITTVTSMDVDGGAPSYAITGGNDQLLFDINPATGALTFKTARDFENPADTGSDNVYEVQVTASDGNSGSDVQTVNVTVTNLAPVANDDASPSWFDETDGGAGYGSFQELSSAYDAYIGTTEQTIDLEGLADATVLSNQFFGSHGVTFSNTGVGASGVYTEGAAWIENLTGYDGSWAPDGGKVYLKMDNDVPGTPFTIDFATPVAKVGALLGMGKEGANHSVIVSLYDSGGGLIEQQTLDAELWDPTSTDQNYETFFGAIFDSAIISKIEILNASNVDYANALIFDQLSWSHTPDAGYLFDAVTAVPLVTGNVLANDADPAGGTLTFVGFTQPANGSVVYNNDGTFIYTSDVGHTGADTFTYTIADDDGLTDTATVTVQVSNTAPTITSDGGGVSAALNVSENTAGVTTVAANDADGHTPTFSITGGVDAALFDINANSGTLTFKVAPDYENPGDTGANNVYDVEVTAADGHGGVDTQTISITVSDSNDAPVARPDGVHLSFDGNDFVQVADHASLQMTNKVTMEAWINPTGLGTGSQLILNKEGEYELGIIADTGEIIFAIADAGNTWAWHYTGQFVTVGEWSHVAVAYDGVAGEAKTYINGQLVDTYSQSGVIGDAYPAFNDLMIGGRGNDAFERFEGQIDEVRVWSTTRTLGEIQSSMDGQLSGAEIGLVGNWRLDEAAGGAVIDQSAFGNDGILGGGEGAAATPSYQGYITDQNTVLNIAAGTGVLANDLDDDGDGLTVTNLDTTGMLGILVLNTADGSFSYDPNGAFDYLDAGEQASETFNYTANDGSLDSNAVTATITVTGVNDNPATNGIADVTVAEDAADSVIDLYAAFADVEDLDPALTYTITGNTNAGLFTSTNIAGGNLTLDYAPDANGTADITVRATDTGGLWVESTFTVTVNPANDNPTTSGIADVTVAEDAADSVIDLYAAFADTEDLDPAMTYTITNNTNAGLFTSTNIAGGNLTLGYAPNANGSADITVRATDTGGLWVQSTFTVTVNPVNDAPVIGGVNTGAVAEDIDPDSDTLLEAAGTLAIADPDAGESNFVAGSIAGSHGNLIIDASGNWNYEADNTQVAIQQLDTGESVNDVLTVTTADGTTHNVTVTINGGEDAPVIGGVTAGTVVKDGTLVANGALSITDADTSDNPVSFLDAASTPGDNGYGDFQLTAGSWSYALNNGHAAVQALVAGDSLTDAHTFIASDGSTQVVSVAITGAAASTPPPVVEPPLPEPAPDPVDRTVPPPAPDDAVDPRVEDESDPEEPTPAGPTDPSAGESEADDPAVIGLNPILPEPLEPSEIFLTVINDARPNDAPGVQKTATAVAKPSAETAQTFLQELKSFWQDKNTTAGTGMSDVRFSQDFWDGLDKMANDLDESVEEQERKMQVSAEAAAGVGISLTAGFVSWALRAGSMAASFLAAMPTWRHFDPMPVLAADDKKQQGAAAADAEDGASDASEEETKLDDLFER
jgi:VCBS repeat-containing protein